MWGSATASHQVEGNNTNNNWWAWEQQPGKILNEAKSGLACDWWGAGGRPRWKEDFDRAAEGYQNAQRFSIEWSRVQPAPDRWDEHAIDRYREMVRTLQELGMTPMVTLHHFTDPLWLVEMGGWESPKIIDLFTTYVHKVVEALQEYVSLWITINEPNCYVYLGYGGGGWPPGKQNQGLAFRVMETMLNAHASAYQTIHALQPKAMVGVANSYRSFQPARTWLPLDTWETNLLRRNWNDQFPQACQEGYFWAGIRKVHVPKAAGTQDFLGINYYSRDRVAFSLLDAKTLFSKRTFPPGAELSDAGFMANVPQGIFEAVKWGRRFKVPIIITENGVENTDDNLRRRFILQHLHQLWRAVNFNWPVKGYFHWSLVDNFEWERGWTQRFGLWELEETTQVRRKRPSVDLYAEICHENGISSEMVTKYAPEIFDSMFPG